MIKVPEKFKGCGVRVHCLKCRSEVTNMCHQKGKSIDFCGFKEKHRFKLVVHIPKTTCKKKTRLLQTDNFDEALVELVKFKAEVKSNLEESTSEIQEVTPANFDSRIQIQNNQSYSSTNKPRYLFIDYAGKYLDSLNGLNTPMHLIRKRSKDHIKSTELIIERFCLSLQAQKYNIETLDLNQIGQREVGIFCDYLVNEIHLESYNKACVIMKAFYNWCIDVEDCECKNPFAKLQLSINLKKDKTAINQNEFADLLKVITYENGFLEKGNKRINLYYPWLPLAYRLALETGLRAEELVTLKFSNIIELHKGVSVFKLVNLKVWRLKTGSDERQIGKYVKYVPITASLKKLLEQCGYDQYRNTDKLIIPFNAEFKSAYAQDIISRSFTHFIKLVTKRKIEYKDLRKTYITHLTMALGNKTKLFTGHSDDTIIQNHYLADAVLMGGLTNLSIFGDCA